MKIVAMIPARLGSKRVVKKNLRLLNGKPLISYIIESAINSNAFDEIYLNSESEIFKDIADHHGIMFYKRNENLAKDSSNNEDFLTDFLSNIKCDYLVQLLPTSPLITSEEIKGFVEQLQGGECDTLVSINSHQIACLYEGNPINFSLTEAHKSSQTMTPIQSYSTVLMGWTSENYLENINNLGCGYHGGKGNIQYFEIKGLASIDIDIEEDFQLAEVAIKFKDGGQEFEKLYYDEISRDRIEIDVPSILKKDGVLQNDFSNENNTINKLCDLLRNTPQDSSWSKRLINTESNSMTLIGQMPGEGNRLHYHPEWNEWWYIVQGSWLFEIEGKEKIITENDIVFIERNKRHRITALGDKLAVRMAVSRADVEHVYPENDE
jgi:CMP-N-acetylneuraminic acid synthetase/quercetin dioxygenase-like cupin family protein